MPYDELHRGDLSYFKNLAPDFVSRSIQKNQREVEKLPAPYWEWSHVGIIVEPKHLRVAEMLPPYGKIRHIAEAYTNYEFAIFRHIFKDPEERYNLLIDAVAQIANVPYSWLGCLSFLPLLGWVKPVERARFCSQAIEAAAELNAELKPDGFSTLENEHVSPGRQLYDGVRSRKLTHIATYSVVDGVVTKLSSSWGLTNGTK